MLRVLDLELQQLGAVRVKNAPPPEPVAVPVAAAIPAGVSADAATDFRRMLRLSKLCLDGEDMTDDQRDALCNMGESLGLTGGQAEDLIDEYLAEVGDQPIQTAPPKAAAPARKPAVAAAPAAAPKVTVAVAGGREGGAAPAVAVVNTSSVARLQERQRYPNFQN